MSAHDKNSHQGQLRVNISYQVLGPQPESSAYYFGNQHLSAVSTAETALYQHQHQHQHQYQYQYQHLHANPQSLPVQVILQSQTQAQSHPPNPSQLIVQPRDQPIYRKSLPTSSSDRLQDNLHLINSGARCTSRRLFLSKISP